MSSQNHVMSTCYAHIDKHILYNKLLRQIQLTKINSVEILEFKTF